jgi:hypothetical protein|tara:strand:- start:81 stop:326 length:246 start_codon:yes stop_codon:yes gene_type:complete
MTDTIYIVDGFVEKLTDGQGIWVVDLQSVEFITWRQNYETNEYFTKMHIGDKDAKLLLETKEEVEELVSAWKTRRGDLNDE